MAIKTPTPEVQINQKHHKLQLESPHLSSEEDSRHCLLTSVSELIITVHMNRSYCAPVIAIKLPKAW